MTHSPARAVSWPRSAALVAALLVVLASLALVPTPARAADAPADRRPEPTAAEQAASEKAIRDLYKAEYVKRDPVERAALARRLLTAAQTEPDATLKYVLLREARDLSAAAGDYPGALDAIDRLAAAYAVDPAAQRATALAAAAKSAASPKAAAEVAEGALAQIDQAVAADDYDTASRRVGPIAQAAAQRAATRTFSPA